MKANERGAHWEKLAEQFLKDRGYKTHSRNFHCRHGELDLIMCNTDTLIFVEVRYRRNDQHGGPLETVDHYKQQRLIAAAQWFLSKHPRLAQLPGRFDCIGITGPASSPNLIWVPNAFTLS